MGLAAFPLIAAGVCCLIVFVIIYVGFSARQMSTMGMVSLRYSLSPATHAILAVLKVGESLLQTFYS